VKVILLEDIRNLGEKGEVKVVKDGYARNYLLPRGLAVEATKSRLLELEKEKQKRAREEVAKEQEARKIAQELEGMSVVLEAKAGEEGKLFGSITSADIAENIKAKGFAITKRQVVLPESIKNLGVTSVEIKLYPGVTAQVKVEVCQKG
jgi:large subunit ribosomal protein L9